MRSRLRTIGCSVLVIVFACPSSFSQAAGASRSTGRTKTSHGKSSWNYDGGIYMVTDGGIPGGPCFRLNGRVTAPGFFDDLKRLDFNDADTVFRRGTEVVTEYPDELLLDFFFHDQPCPEQMVVRAHTYLTRELVSALRLNLYWKHGIELRPVSSVTTKYFAVQRRAPYAPVAASDPDVPEKLEWSYVYAVPSAGIPLTDSLVLIVRTPNGRVAARVAARM